MNIPRSSRDRSLFDNAVGGNGFDAWRRLTEPIGPNSEERVLEMYKEVINPKTSKHVSDVLHDLAHERERWRHITGVAAQRWTRGRSY